MLYKDHPIRNIPRNKLEVWQEANVRKTSTDVNLEELAENIKHNGIENPLLVKETNDKYKIFAGQRRFLASGLADLDILPCRVFKNISLNNAISLSLSENIFSKQMTTLDKADAVKSLLATYKDKKKVCSILGIKPSTLQSYLHYHGLTREIKQLVDQKLVNMQFAVRVFRKFSKSNAAEILHEFSRTRKATIQRKLLTSAILQADKDDSLEDIKSNIKKLNSKEFSMCVNLEAHELKILEKIARKNKLSLEHMSSELLRKVIKRAKV